MAVLCPSTIAQSTGAKSIATAGVVSIARPSEASPGTPERAGGILSLTLIVNSAVLGSSVTASVAVRVTVVRPSWNVLPGAGAQLTLEPGKSSVTIGSV
jgi:hypothetical protein